MSSDTVSQIKERLDIVDTLGAYLKLEKAGRNWKARCPFHNEKTPSFLISPERQSYYCFGCQAKGDVFSFVEQFEGLDFKGALTMLADKVGVKLEKWSGEKQDNKDYLFGVMEAATRIFEDNLEINEMAQNYLQKRGLSKDSIKKWRVGFARDEWRDVHDKLVSLGFNRKQLLEAGLVKKVEGEEKYYDTFRSRVMFPIFDGAGRPIAFSGRLLGENANAPKYLNSPETALFHKSEALYGFNFAKENMRRQGYAVLVEGQMDLVLSHQAGVGNTVASSGTALTEMHLKRISKLCKRIVFAYDSDEAGQKAAKRSTELALRLGMEVKIAKLPPGEDPASIIEKSSDAWKESLKKTEDFIEFLINEALVTGKNLNLGRRVNELVIPYLAALENEIILSQYAALVSDRTGIAVKAILDEVLKYKTAAKNNVGKELPQSAIEPLSLSSEDMLVGLLLWQENSPNPGLDTKLATTRLEEILTKEGLSEIRENSRFDRDTLIFEAEVRFASLDPSKVFEEFFSRLESQVLNKKLMQLGKILDSAKNKEEKEEVESQIKIIFQKLNKN